MILRDFGRRYIVVKATHAAYGTAAVIAMSGIDIALGEEKVLDPGAPAGDPKEDSVLMLRRFGLIEEDLTTWKKSRRLREPRLHRN